MKRKSSRAILLVALPTILVVASLAPAQQPARPGSPEADPADVESVDAILAALYDVISGPAGEREWNRFRSLFASDAILVPMVPGQDGTTAVRTLSPEDYVAWGDPFFRENAFYERETGRTLERFGNLASVMSAYDSRRAPDEEPFARGINAITLVTDGARWYVVSIAWDQVREGNPMPEWMPIEEGASSAPVQ